MYIERQSSDHVSCDRRLWSCLCGNAHLPIAALLLLAEPQRTEHLSPEAVGRIDEGHLVVVDSGAFPDQIDFVRLEEAGTLDELPGDEGDRSCEALVLLTSSFGRKSDLPTSKRV
jgi:hypothetical protein